VSTLPHHLLGLALPVDRNASTQPT
jgi:hypothetical protein